MESLTIYRPAAYAFDRWDHMGGWSWAGMSLMLLLLIALVVWATWAVIRSVAEQRHPTAMEILEQRYARGEIDEEELRRRRETLEGGVGSEP